MTYATLNVPGFLQPVPTATLRPTRMGAALRNQANIAWMQQTFDEAKSHHSAAVMFISQADAGLRPRTGPALRCATPRPWLRAMASDGFQEFLTALRDQVIAFAKRVAYVRGDSHYFPHWQALP